MGIEPYLFELEIRKMNSQKSKQQITRIHKHFSSTLESVEKICYIGSRK